MLKLLRAFETARPFTEPEAWFMFRAAAFGEAAGWTFLIVGIALRIYGIDPQGNVVAVAGRAHGMLFVVYMAAALGLYPTLGWRRLRGLCALAMSVPPYGSLLMEIWGTHTRKNAGFKSYRHFLVYNVLMTIS